MNTPTDDLRARLLAAGKRVEEMIRLRETRSPAIVDMREWASVMHEAIAALSALPAAGWMVAEIMEASERDGAYLTHCNVRLRVYNGYVPAVGDSIYTTPQPSAAEEVEWDGATRTMQEHLYLMTGERDRYKALHEQAAPTIARMERRIAEMDAAVGAQVDDDSQFGPVTDAELGEPDPIHRNLLAAPAAEKGVDDALRHIVKVLGPSVPSSVTDDGARYEWESALYVAKNTLAGLRNQSPSYDALLLIAQSVCGALSRAGFDDTDDPGEAIDVMREGYEAKLAALTRQPVAGDVGLSGEVHSAAFGVAVIHVDCSYFGPHMIGPGKKVRIFVDAPADTPADGGEGSK